MDSNQTLSPTVPQNRDIFDAKQTPVVDKPKIIAQVVGPKRFSPKLIFVLLGIVIFLLVAMIFVKSVVMKNSQSKEVKITWWSLEEDEEAVQPLIDEYKQKNPNVVVNFVKQTQQDYRVRLANSIAKGNGPDIFEFHNSWVVMFKNDLSVNPSDLSSTFYPVIANDLKTKNGFLGIPLEYDGIALFVNQDIMHAYGKNPPKTWDDLRKEATGLTIHDQNGDIRQSGASLGVTTNVDYWQDIFALLSLQNGADLTLPSSLMGQSALTFFTNFSKVDKVWNETLPSSSTYFGQGKLAFYFGKFSDASGFSKNPNLHFQVVPLPQLPSFGLPVPSISYASYWVNGVSNKSANSNVAWDFLSFMASRESLEKLYNNEKKVRGYGNLYPRVDMQNELLSDTIAGPFIYQASFAKSWYLNDKTFNGPTGINSQVAKPFSDAISTTNGNSNTDQAVKTLQIELTKVLASYGLVRAPVATSQ